MLQYLVYAFPCTCYQRTVHLAYVMRTGTSDHDPSDMSALILAIGRLNPDDVSCLKPVDLFVMIPVFYINDAALV